MAASNLLLAANQPQGMGMAVNASQSLGLGAPGANLQDQLQEEVQQRRKALGLGGPANYGAATALFGTMK